MNDITFCEGDNCPIKYKCRRYTGSKVEFMEYYYTEIPYNHEEKKCEKYLKSYKNN